MLNKKTRDRLLRVASMLDGWAARISKLVRASTPRRRKAEE